MTTNCSLDPKLASSYIISMKVFLIDEDENQLNFKFIQL